jgi:hypothetical protein
MFKTLTPVFPPRLSGSLPPGAQGSRRLLEDLQHAVHRIAGRARRRIPPDPERRQEQLRALPARLHSLENLLLVYGRFSFGFFRMRIFV